MDNLIKLIKYFIIYVLARFLTELIAPNFLNLLSNILNMQNNIIFSLSYFIVVYVSLSITLTITGFLSIILKVKSFGMQCYLFHYLIDVIRYSFAFFIYAAFSFNVVIVIIILTILIAMYSLYKKFGLY